MSSDPLAPVLVHNRYRVGLMTARQFSQSEIEFLNDLFKQAIREFTAGAWVGGLADDRFLRLTGLQEATRSATKRINQDFDDAIQKQQLEVPADSWEANWKPEGWMPWPW